MPAVNRVRNRTAELRKGRGWSQAELARRAGISRAAVSAIEINRLVPSVAAALSLARVLDCSVEELFGGPRPSETGPVWAWEPPRGPSRFWQSRVGDRVLRYPVEAIPLGVIPHDGTWQDGASLGASETAPEDTIVLACCDPAAGLLARKLQRMSRYRLLVLQRSSGQAIELLRLGLVHAAGLHFSTPDRQDRNAEAVRSQLGAGAHLVRIATWEEGLAVSSQAARPSVRSLLKSRRTWIGRELGSAARECQDELLEGRAAPRRVAHDHRGVAESIRCGWAQLGVCHRLVCEEAGLRFLPVRREAYDLCYRAEDEHDPRIEALVRALQSASYRRILSELPGYACRETGLVTTI